MKEKKAKNSEICESSSAACCSAGAAGEAQKYGEQEIAAICADELERWPNEAARDYEIAITLPEFACRCPRSGYPDFATLRLVYVPRKWLIELKAIKLYVNTFYNRHISHEAAVNEIFETLRRRLKPKYMKLEGDFNPRGNVHTVIKCEYKRKKKKKSGDI